MCAGLIPAPWQACGKWTDNLLKYGMLQARFFCNAMPWVDCTALRYHCTKMPDVDLCPEAFAEGRFPPGCTAKDFIRIEAGKRPVCFPPCFTSKPEASTLRQCWCKMPPCPQKCWSCDLHHWSAHVSYVMKSCCHYMVTVTEAKVHLWELCCTDWDKQCCHDCVERQWMHTCAGKPAGVE
jgi:hypothetical protein